MLQQSTIKFLKDLKKNNNKPWFDAHRDLYEKSRADFASFAQLVIDKYGKIDPSIKTLVAKDCMFRINRDIRFSKDKTPYKTNFSASINKSGKKGPASGYYFHVEPGGSFVCGGMWMPTPDQLKNIRQEIDYNLEGFKKIVNEKKFRALFKTLDQSKEYLLMRVPKGYLPDNPAAAYLKMKSYIALADIDDKYLGSKDLSKKVLAGLEAAKPLVDFLNEAVGLSGGK